MLALHVAPDQLIMAAPGHDLVRDSFAKTGKFFKRMGSYGCEQRSHVRVNQYFISGIRITVQQRLRSV
jgi:hypothetical protein